jgi:hypothetical protein
VRYWYRRIACAEELTKRHVKYFLPQLTTVRLEVRSNEVTQRSRIGEELIGSISSVLRALLLGTYFPKILDISSQTYEVIS